MQTLDRVARVDDSAHLGRIGEERNHLLPVTPPGRGDRRVAPAPRASVEGLQRVSSGFSGLGPVDGFQRASGGFSTLAVTEPCRRSCGKSLGRAALNSARRVGFERRGGSIECYRAEAARPRPTARPNVSSSRRCANGHTAPSTTTPRTEPPCLIAGSIITIGIALTRASGVTRLSSAWLSPEATS
jgi:hypothetical protein